MHARSWLLSMLMLLAALAGCLAEDDPGDGGGADPTDAPGDGDGGAGNGTGGGGNGTGGGQGGGGGGGNNTTAPEPDETTLDEFSSNQTGGETPLSVGFTLAARSPDEDATWTVDFGDGEDVTGRVSDLPANIEHVYNTTGNFTANATIDASDAQPSASIQITVIEAAEDPAETEFTYGPTLGCAGDVTGTCMSLEAGPDGPAVDGVWQELDARYWGLAFTTTVQNQRGDSDCWALDENMEILEDDLNGGAEECRGTLPAGTAWLFLYSYAEPAPQMTLTFEV